MSVMLNICFPMFSGSTFIILFCQVGAQKNSGSQDLASLFTDLDPLGSGKSKPFMDRKDFFNDSKAKKSMTGASEDSLNNVGLGFSDSIFEPTNPSMLESTYTNSVLSSSMSSRYSDQLWATLPSRPAVPTIHTAAWDPPPPHRPPARPSQPPHGHRSTSLRVALPPEEGRRSASPSASCIKTQNSNAYGSILELEASPRRYRNKELREFYYSSQDSPTYSRTGSNDYAEGSSIDSSLNLPPPMEPPPALPERLPKLTSLSPPPLPPKKQSGGHPPLLTSSLGPPLSRLPLAPPHNESFDIYDFIPDLARNSSTPDLLDAAPPLPAREPELTVQDLTSMSVVELAQKLAEGRLPAALSGLSLLQLVEHVAKAGRQEQQPQLPSSSAPTSHYMTMQPSFSDNFGDNFLAGSQQVQHSHYIYAEPLEEEQPETPPLPRLSPLPPSPRPPSSQPPASHSSSVHGFEDDFSQFGRQPLSSPLPTAPSAPSPNPSPAPTLGSLPTVAAATSYEHDRYAVFRELQLEEELVNAWKSPTEDGMSVEDLMGQQEEEEKCVVEDLMGREEADEEVEAVGSIEDLMEQQVDEEQYEEPEQYEEAEEELNQEEEQGDLFYAPSEEVLAEDTGSSENSPCSHSDLGSRRSNDDRGGSNDGSNEQEVEEEAFEPPAYDPPVLDHHLDHPVISNGNLPQKEKQEPGNENDAFEDNFYTAEDGSEQAEDNSMFKSSFGDGWATFEESSGDKTSEFSDFLSKDDQDKILSQNSHQSSLLENRTEVYSKLQEDQPPDQGYSSREQEPAEAETRSRFQSPKALRDLPNPTAALQARYLNFKRFDQQQEESPKATFSAQRLPEEQEDPFDADWEPAFYTRRSQSTDPEHGEPEGGGWHLTTPRPGTEPPRQWSSVHAWRDPPPPPLPVRSGLNIEEAFPPARPAKSSRHSSSRGSSDSIFNNPFADNFVMNSLGVGSRGVSATPPVFEGQEVQCDRISNASDLSFHSRDEFLESQDVFEKKNAFTSGFKVQAKTMKLPKSESVDIFSVQADPFDDDFFK